MIKRAFAVLVLGVIVMLLGGTVWFWLDAREARTACEEAVEDRMSKEWEVATVEWGEVDYRFGSERSVVGSFTVERTEVGSEFTFDCLSADGAVTYLNVDVKNPG